MTRNTLCDFYLFVTINSEIADIPLDASCLSVCPSAVQHLECCLLLLVTLASDSSSSSHMRFMSHNWSATKQRLHPQSVAEISRHSVLPGGQDSTMCDIVWVLPQGHRSVSCQSPFPATGTPLFRAKTVQQRPLLLREVKTQLPDCGVTH